MNKNYIVINENQALAVDENNNIKLATKYSNRYDFETIFYEENLIEDNQKKIEYIKNELKKLSSFEMPGAIEFLEYSTYIAMLNIPLDYIINVCLHEKNVAAANTIHDIPSLFMICAFLNAVLIIIEKKINESKNKKLNEELENLQNYNEIIKRELETMKCETDYEVKNNVKGLSLRRKPF